MFLLFNVIIIALTLSLYLSISLLKNVSGTHRMPTKQASAAQGLFKSGSRRRAIAQTNLVSTKMPRPSQHSPKKRSASGARR